MVERRKRMRKSPQLIWTEGTRDAFKLAMSEALAAHHEATLAGMSPEDHAADHAFVAPLRKFWRKLDTTVTDNFWSGLGGLVKAVMFAFGIGVVSAILGSLASATFREWIGVALRALAPAQSP